MKLKKLLILFMMLSMVVCATACGNSDEDDIRGQINKDTESESQNSESSEDTEINNTTENSETSENEEPSLSLNNAKGSTYESSFMGLGWTLPDGWIFFNEDQLKQMNNITADMIDDKQIQEALKNATLICDMYAMNSITGDTINIQLEKLTGLTSLYDAETYVDASISSLPSALQSAGYTNITTEKTTVTIAGEDHPGISLAATYSGVVVYEKLACIKIGNYMAVITTASTTEANLDVIFANFYSLK